MLDEESVKTYKNITLSRDLRADILDTHATQKAPRFFGGKALRPIAALCSLVLISAVVLSAVLQNRPGIYAANIRLNTSPRTATVETVRYTDPRMRFHLFEQNSADALTSEASDCIALRPKFGRDVTVSVTDGALLLPDDVGNYTFGGFSGIVKNGDALYWSLTDCEALSPLTAVFTDADGNALGTVTLTYVKTDNGWTVSGTLSEK